MMNESAAKRAARRNSRSARSGRILRSMPTIPPTKALTITSRANCATFSRRPSRSDGWIDAIAAVVTASSRRRHRFVTAIERKDRFHLGRLRRHVGELLNEGVALECEHRIPTFFEANRGHRFATQAGAADGSGEMARIDF